MSRSSRAPAHNGYSASADTAFELLARAAFVDEPLGIHRLGHLKISFKTLGSDSRRRQVDFPTLPRCFRPSAAGDGISGMYPRISREKPPRSPTDQDVTSRVCRADWVDVYVRPRHSKRRLNTAVMYGAFNRPELVDDSRSAFIRRGDGRADRTSQSGNRKSTFLLDWVQELSGRHAAWANPGAGPVIGESAHI